MNLQRIYEYRFEGIDQHGRVAVWSEIAKYVEAVLGRPGRLLDPAGGRGEFINAASAAERWFVDMMPPADGALEPEIKVLVGDVFETDLPPDYFDGIFVSNFLEHLSSQKEVAAFLAKLHAAQSPRGRIAVLGPNFQYCYRQYFDCADHTVALTHLSVAEHLYGAGFDIARVTPRFLPFSFRGLLPPSASLTRLYLRSPLLWRLLGKQFLVIGQKAGSV
jgi:hypothetical protein